MLKGKRHISLYLPARLQELKGLELLRERHGSAEGTFVFTHALTREVAYEGMLQARRRHLHGRAAAALERSRASRFEQCELLGYHYARSAEPQRAIGYLAAAEDRARDRYANEEAITTYRRALDLIDELDGDHQAEIYGAICESLGRVLHRLSRFDAAIDACPQGLAAPRPACRPGRVGGGCGEPDGRALVSSCNRSDCETLILGSVSAIMSVPEPAWSPVWTALVRRGLLGMWLATGLRLHRHACAWLLA